MISYWKQRGMILNELRLEFNVNDKIDAYFDAFNWVDDTMYELMKG